MPKMLRVLVFLAATLVGVASAKDNSTAWRLELSPEFQVMKQEGIPRLHCALKYQGEEPSIFDRKVAWSREVTLEVRRYPSSTSVEFHAPAYKGGVDMIDEFEVVRPGEEIVLELHKMGPRVLLVDSFRHMKEPGEYEVRALYRRGREQHVFLLSELYQHRVFAGELASNWIRIRVK